MEGSVERVECEPYEIANEETGEITQLDNRWVFVKPCDTIEEAAKAAAREAKLG